MSIRARVFLSEMPLVLGCLSPSRDELSLSVLPPKLRLGMEFPQVWFLSRKIMSLSVQLELLRSRSKANLCR